MLQENDGKLSDIRKIEKIVEKVRLQDLALRRELMRRLKEKKIFTGEIGEQFLILLREKAAFSSYESQVSYLEHLYQIEQQLMKEYAEQKRERALINKLVSGRDLNRTEDVDEIYELMLKHKGRMFCSPLGERFVELVQCRTSKYKEIEKKCRKLTTIAMFCSGVALLVLIPILCLHLSFI